MSRWTGDDFVNNVRRGLGNPPKSKYTDTQILGYVNKAANDVIGRIIAEKRIIPELYETSSETVASGTANVDMTPSDIVRILFCQLSSNGDVLTSIDDKRHAKQNQSSTAQTGTPRKYFENGKGIYNTIILTLFPVPDADDTLVVHYMEELPAITQDPSATSFVLKRVPYDSLIFSVALEQMLRLDGQRAEAQDEESKQGYLWKMAYDLCPLMEDLIPQIPDAVRWMRK